MTSVFKVIDLWAVANLMKSDKMKYVELSLDEEDGSLSITAIKSPDDYEAIDYDPIEPVANNLDSI